MPLKNIPNEPARPVKENDPQDLGLSADFLRWISFEGCCTPATGVAVNSKLPAKPEVERERARALEAPPKTLRSGD
jgi:hypothetical protein